MSNVSKTMADSLSKEMVKVQGQDPTSKTIMDKNKMIDKVTEIKSEDNKNEKPIKKKKKEAREATSSGASGQYSAPLFTQSRPETSPEASKVPKVESVNGGETVEATSTSSTGQYSTPGWIAPSAKKWRGLSKTQIPGGKFVQIKKKCQKFPYCNQGDIKSLKLYENEMVRDSIKSLSQKLGVNENVIKAIIQHELEERMIKRKK
jgi:hypothetical protein